MDPVRQIDHYSS